jgi:hypothetical protein
VCKYSRPNKNFVSMVWIVWLVSFANERRLFLWWNIGSLLQLDGQHSG